MEKKRLVEGMKFGMLTTIRQDGSDNSGYAIWLCRCDCGNLIKKTAKQLKSFTEKNLSCGCDIVPLVDVGMTFGNLTVIDKIQDSKEDRRWVCRCECGNIVQRNTTELTRKRYPSRSCGCKRKTRLMDLSGQTFGGLYVIMRAQDDKHGKTQWFCECQYCGKWVIVSGSELKRKGRRSITHCGCQTSINISEAKKTHGMSRHPAWGVWHSMKQRCLDPNHQAWHNYGGRGITVCDRWLDGFENFWEDMGSTWKEGLDLDRIDNDKGYSPDNCRWISRKINCRNKRNSRYVDSIYGRKNVAELSEMTGIKENALLYRIQSGFPPELLCLPPDSTQSVSWMAPSLFCQVFFQKLKSKSSSKVI